ncbi:MAG TPA: DUF4142 domain-containing protein [Polyangiales bacterium]|nr:DUF4142 domain-containing protein [Polyangiales bacterium]
MLPNTRLCLVAAGALAALSACSSNEGASQEYPQPAATQGDEATPPERNTQAPAPNPNAPSEPLPTPPSRVPVEAGPTSAIVTPGTESLRDTQIVQVTQSADQAEIEQAGVARNKARDTRVKAFAEQMFQQHTRSKQESAELARKANLAPEDSRAAAELQAQARTTLQLLRTIDASQFDATYLNSQVQQHTELLKLLDEQLIPSASNTDLKAALRDMRSVVARHLSDAKELASNVAR